MQLKLYDGEKIEEQTLKHKAYKDAGYELTAQYQVDEGYIVRYYSKPLDEHENKWMERDRGEVWGVEQLSTSGNW